MGITINIKKLKINPKIFVLLLNLFFLASCAKEAQIKIFSPAEINTINLKNIAVSEFEIGQILLKYKTER